MTLKKLISIFACLLTMAPYSLYAFSKQNTKGKQTKEAVKKSLSKKNDQDDELLNSVLNDPEYLKAKEEVGKKPTIENSKKITRDELKIALRLSYLFDTMLDFNNQDIDPKLIDEAIQIIIKTTNKKVINFQDLNGNTILIKAAGLYNGDSNLPKPEGMTAIEKIVKMLLDHGANLSFSNEKGDTPLTIAAKVGNQSIAKILLEHGANSNISIKTGDTPLIIATFKENESIVKMLLEHKANPNAQNNYGDTPLIVAAFKDNESIVKMLLDYKAEPNIAKNDGMTPLMLADHESIIKMLLDYKAEPNIANNNQDTPLLFAAFKENESVVKMLLEHKAIPNVLNKEGETPLMLATQANNELIVKMLLEAGADPLFKNNEGINALKLAKKDNLEHKNKIKALGKSYQSLHNSLQNKQTMHDQEQARNALIEEEESSLQNIVDTAWNFKSIDWNSYWADEDEQRFLNRNN